MSDIHFVSTKRSKEFIIKMGELKSRVFLTGCPSIDLAKIKNYKLTNNFFNKIGSEHQFFSSEKIYLSNSASCNYRV